MTEKTSDTYRKQSGCAGGGAPKWALLMNDGRSYMLKEKELSGTEARKLLNGKYRGRDVILTVSAGDIAGRIESLNAVLV